MDTNKDSNLYKLAESINLNLNEYELLVEKLVFNPDLIDLEAFKKRLEKEINDIDCTPSKDGVTVEEIQDFFKEIDHVPHKLQRHKKNKELSRLNATVIQRRGTVKEFYNSPCNSTQIASNITLGISTKRNTALKIDCSLTPKEIFNNFKECKLNLESNMRYFKNNSKNLQTYNNEIEKVEKFILELEATTKNYDDQSNVEAFTEEENLLYDFVNAIEQLAFVAENQNLYLKEESEICNNKLKILMDTVNDLLKIVI